MFNPLICPECQEFGRDRESRILPCLGKASLSLSCPAASGDMMRVRDARNAAVKTYGNRHGLRLRYHQATYYVRPNLPGPRCRLLANLFRIVQYFERITR